MERNIQCNKCRYWRYEEYFVSNNRKLKFCSVCRKNAKKHRDTYKDKMREKNKKYYEEQISEKNKKYNEDQKLTNPLTTKIKRMVHNSIHCDVKYNRLYDPKDYIDEDFLHYVWNDQSQQCYHCNCEMTLDFNTQKRNPTQISIQRLNNDLPHIKINCVLSCLTCNVKRKENQ